MAKLRVTANLLTPAQLAPFFLEQLPNDDDNRLQKLAHLVAQCASVHNAATYLAEAEDWDFLAVYYDMIDHAGHDFAQYEAPRMEHVSEEDFKIYRYVIESTYRYHDMMLGRWLELVDDDTAVIRFVRSRVLSRRREAPGGTRASLGRTAQGRPYESVGLASAAWRLCRARTWYQDRRACSQCIVTGHRADNSDASGRGRARRFRRRNAHSLFSKKRSRLETTPSLEAPHPEDGIHRGAPAEEKDPWAAQQAVAQLAELGYIDSPEGGAAEKVAMAIEAHDSHLAQIYFATGRFTEALDLLKNLAKRSEDPSYPARQAMCLIALRRVEEADAIVREILATNPHYGLAQNVGRPDRSNSRENCGSGNNFLRIAKSRGRDADTAYSARKNLPASASAGKNAADFFRRALEADPDFARSARRIGRGAASSWRIRRSGTRTYAGGFVAARPGAIAHQFRDKPRPGAPDRLGHSRVYRRDRACADTTLSSSLSGADLSTNPSGLREGAPSFASCARVTKKAGPCHAGFSARRLRYHASSASLSNEPQAEVFEYSVVPACRTEISLVVYNFAPNSRARLEKNQSSETPTALKFPGTFGSGIILSSKANQTFSTHGFRRSTNISPVFTSSFSCVKVGS